MTELVAKDSSSWWLRGGGHRRPGRRPRLRRSSGSRGLLDVPVEFVRAARRSGPQLGGWRGSPSRSAKPPRLEAFGARPIPHTRGRPARRARPRRPAGALDVGLVEAGRARRRRGARRVGPGSTGAAGGDFEGGAERPPSSSGRGRPLLRGRAGHGRRPAVRANRLRLLLDVRDAVGSLGDLSADPALTAGARPRPEWPTGRATRRLRLDGRDRAALVLAVEAQFPRLDVRGGPPPADRRASTTSSSPWLERAGPPASSSTRSSSPSSARRCGRSASATAFTTATCSAIRSTRSRACRALPARDEPGAGLALDSDLLQAVAAIEFAVKFDDGAPHRPGGGGHRPRRRVAHVEDAALDLPRLPRLQGGERPVVRGSSRRRSSSRSSRHASSALTIEPGLPRSASAASAICGAASGRTPSSVEIYEELEHAEGVHRRLGCPVIEVSNLAIEETAHRIIRLVEERRRPRTSACAVSLRRPRPG